MMEEMKLKPGQTKCPTCDGFGAHPESIDQPCPTCDGKGVLFQQREALKKARDQFAFYAGQHAAKVSAKFGDDEEARPVDIIWLHQSRATLRKALTNIEHAIACQEAMRHNDDF